MQGLEAHADDRTLRILCHEMSPEEVEGEGWSIRNVTSEHVIRRS